MKFQDTVSIYLDGYKTGGNHDLEKWFEARGRLFENREYFKQFQVIKNRANAEARDITRGR